MILIRKIIFFLSSGHGLGPHTPGEILLEGSDSAITLEGSTDIILEE